MAEFSPSDDLHRHIVTARLSLRPSDALQEAVAPLYKPSAAEKKLGRLTLRSSIGVPLEMLPGRQFVYENPRHPDRNSIQEYEQYQRSHVRLVVERPLPLLSEVDVLRNQAGALRLRLRFGLGADEQAHLSQLHEFRRMAQDPLLGAQLDIAPSEVMPNDEMLRGAVMSLRSVLGVAHPARKHIATHERYVGDRYYAKIASEQLSFRIGE